MFLTGGCYAIFVLCVRVYTRVLFNSERGNAPPSSVQFDKVEDEDEKK